MSKNLIVIKFGGSIVTDKSKSNPTPRIDVIDNLSKQVNKLFNTNKHHFILVHGAGSYGHPIAKKYSLSRGMKTKKQKIAFSEINQFMLDLNKIIIESLIKHHLPVINFIPHSFISQSAGKFKGFNYQLIKSAILKNQIPVLYGDCVLDDKWGCSILSGDTIVSYLGKKLSANKVIYLSDVDGIYDSDPKKNSQAKLIPQINDQNLKKIMDCLTPNNDQDVTGEMKGKITSLKKYLLNTTIYITNGFKENVLYESIVDNKINGTQLFFKGNKSLPGI